MDTARTHHGCTTEARRTRHGGTVDVPWKYHEHATMETPRWKHQGQTMMEASRKAPLPYDSGTMDLQRRNLGPSLDPAWT